MNSIFPFTHYPYQKVKFKWADSVSSADDTAALSDQQNALFYS